MNDVPPDLLRGLTMPRLSRRRALQVGGLSVLGMSLAACGIPGANSGSKELNLTDARKEIKKFWQEHDKKTGQLNFENWPLYIDVSDNGKSHPSLDLFTKETGIKVKYDEGIQDDDSYFGKIQPVLASGDSIGWDIIVITNGIYLDKLIGLNYLIPLDQNAMSNFYTYSSPLVLDPSFDRGNVYTMAWQSGMTGIAYNPKYVDREITSWEDLRDPAFKGKVGMFADIEDTPNSALCAIGVNPETSTEADWHKAAAWLEKQRPLVRKYYQQDYIAPLSKGDLWISLAWSGDIFQANASGANLKFVVPKEGCPLWTDNMCIPVHAAHPRDAMIYMDWVYQPKIATMLAEYINYITPVPACEALILEDAKNATSKDDKESLEALADSPLIFPRKGDYSKLHRYRVLDPVEEKIWDRIFEPIYQS
jgi:spermidine/putrescine transport system substrate-binding protein